MLFNREANETAAEFIRGKIRAIVRDPAVAEMLTPHAVVGCKRLCSDTGYFETFNRPNVTLVDVAASPIEEITAARPPDDGRASYDARLHRLRDRLRRHDRRAHAHRHPRHGRASRSREKWAEGPRTYLGLATAGFPNLFIITGPGSPSVLSNMVPSIEQHANWIAALHRATCARAASRRIEATPDAEDAWVAHVNEVADGTLYPSCNSWYLGANIPGKPRVFMPYLGFPAYVEKCDEVAAKGYEGFELR